MLSNPFFISRISTFEIIKIVKAKKVTREPKLLPNLYDIALQNNIVKKIEKSPSTTFTILKGCNFTLKSMKNVKFSKNPNFKLKKNSTS